MSGIEELSVAQIREMLEQGRITSYELVLRYMERVALIDDVIATGESLAAIENLAKSAGAEIVARAAILAELGAVHRKDIIFLKEHYVFRPNPDGTFTPISSLDE